MKKSGYLQVIIIFHLFVSMGFSQTNNKIDYLTVKADSLHANGDYEIAFELRKQAVQKFSSSNPSYNYFLEAKRCLTESCMYEKKAYNYHNPKDSISKQAHQNYFRLAIEKSRQAKKIYEKVKKPDKLFKYEIQSRIYHQLGFTGKWNLALAEAELGLRILKDTLSGKDKKMVDLIHDIGFINAELGDYSKAIEYYKASLALYISNIGEKTTDVALSYNNIGAQYRKIGLRKNELEYLLKAKTIWEQLNNDEDIGHLYVCYGNLFSWYSYYGDYEKAEEYLLKREKIRQQIKSNPKISFIKNQEDKYKDRLREWHDLMLHFARRRDTGKTISFAKAIADHVIKPKKLLNFEVKTIGSSLKFEAEIHQKKNPDLALEKLDQAIKIQETYREEFFTKVFPYKLHKAEILIAVKRMKEAQLILRELNALRSEMTLQENFTLNILNAKVSQELNDAKAANNFYEKAFALLSPSVAGNLETIPTADLKPLISFETIDGFLAMGDFFMDRFKKTSDRIDADKALRRYIIASEIYNQLYLGERYNERLFSVNNEINERLLSGSVLTNNTGLTAVINTIENNASKLIWSKFVFNNKRIKFKIPQSQLNREEQLKTELNFYQRKISESGTDHKEKVILWKHKVYDLKNELAKIEAIIRKQNPVYYQFNIKEFDVKSLQQTLKEKETILKYSLTNKNGYVFLITKNNVSLVSLGDKNEILTQLNKSLWALKNREADYRHHFIKLKDLLFRHSQSLNYHKLTVIPDGPLHYLPFEVLLMDAEMPLISYAASLMLYQEQRNINPSSNKVNVGAFSAYNTISKLPKAETEATSILKFFNGKSFVNASKKDFLHQANSFNVLHLAMHSTINEENPEFSSLNFYGSKNAHLLLSELYNENLTADLAVLSACDTGNGFYENGEGVISMSRAFNYAGIPSTVMSLWKVDDEATSKIMNYFYARLSKGEAKDEALKNAKLDYLQNTEDALLKHPYYWSGFVLSGNSDPLVKNDYGLHLILSLTLVLLAFLLYHRNKLIQFFK